MVKKVIAHTKRPRKSSPSKREPVKRRRLKPDLRAKQILSGAITFFAEHGFGGQTRELTAELGVSKGLLYRYFPSKEALIDRVYEEVFLRRWSPEREAALRDRSLPLIERLKVFYIGYAEMVLEYKWSRIYLFSGLAGASITRRYIKIVIERIFKPVINELRGEFGFPPIEQLVVTEPELELMWSLHGSIFYIAVRQWVYKFPVPSDIDSTIEQLVEGFYVNAKNMMQRVLSRNLPSDVYKKTKCASRSDA